MSGVSLVFLLSPTRTLQSRYACLVPSRAELCRCSWDGKQGCIRGQKESGVSNKRDRVAAKAGIGRYSGAVHGGNTRRARRRRLPPRPDGCDESSSGDENDSVLEERREKMDTTYEESSMQDVIHGDGEPATNLTDSYQRYLSEIGLIQNAAGQEYQLHSGDRVADGSTWVPIGPEGDLGYHQAGTVVVSNNVEDDRKGVNGAWAGGVDGDGNEDSKKVENSKIARGRKVRKKKVDSSKSTGYIAEVEPVVATVISNPELFSEQFLEKADRNEKSVSNQSSAVQLTENDFLDDKDMSVLSSSGVGGKSRKQRGKSREKSGMNTALSAESPIDERQVRVVDGEAEQPFVSQTLSSNHRGRRGKRDSDTGITSVGPNVELQTTVIGPEERQGSGMDKDICETPEAGNVNEECCTVSVVSLEDPVNQSKATICDSMMDPVKDTPEEASCAFSFLGSEHFNDKLGESSEFMYSEVERGVVKTNTEAEIEDTVENGQFGIEVQENNPSAEEMLLINSVVEQAVQVVNKVAELPSQVASKVVEIPTQVASKVVELPSTIANKVVELPTQVASKVVELPSQVLNKVVELPTQIANKVVELPSQIANSVVELPAQVASKVADLPAQVASKVVELPGAVVEQATQVGTLVVEHVADILPDAVTEQVGQVVSQVVDLQTQISDQVFLVADHILQVGQMMVDQAAEAGESVVDQVSATAEQVVQVAESVTNTANQVVGQVTERVTDILSFDEEDESDSDDEFQSYKTSDNPAFRGSAGLANFVILQEDEGVLAKIYDFYTYMLKQPLPKFAAAMFSAPIIVSLLFTLLYLPEYKGLAFDDIARDFFAADGGGGLTLQMSWSTVFVVFMFSLSLSTGLQPELAPLSPYTLIVANINALVAQLVFVFLSGAVFARLSQPSQPVRCSTVALVSTSPAQRKHKENAIKVLVTRYVLAGPQPCELVDVKVDLTYKYNTVTRTGSYFRATQSLKLVRPEIAFLTHGMLVRHVIDSTSPLYQRTSEMLKKEDAVFVLSVVGLERSSMQSVFHVQHYCVCDDDVIWDAEFEDLILINSKKNKRIVDHTRLSTWRSIEV